MRNDLFGCSIDAPKQQMALNFEWVVSDQLFSVLLVVYKWFKISAPGVVGRHMWQLDKTTVFRPVCCLVILCCDSIGLQNCRSSNFSSHQHMTVQQKKHKWSQLRHLHEYFILPDGITCKVQNFSSLVIGVYFMLGLLYIHLSPNSL